MATKEEYIAQLRAQIPNDIQGSDTVEAKTGKAQLEKPTRSKDEILADYNALKPLSPEEANAVLSLKDYYREGQFDPGAKTANADVWTQAESQWSKDRAPGGWDKLMKLATTVAMVYAGGSALGAWGGAEAGAAAADVGTTAGWSAGMTEAGAGLSAAEEAGLLATGSGASVAATTAAEMAFSKGAVESGWSLYSMFQSGYDAISNGISNVSDYLSNAYKSFTGDAASTVADVGGNAAGNTAGSIAEEGTKSVAKSIAEQWITDPTTGIRTLASDGVKEGVSKGLISTAMDWAGKNPVTALMAANTALGFVGGIGQARAAEEAARLNRETQLAMPAAQQQAKMVKGAWSQPIGISPADPNQFLTVDGRYINGPNKGQYAPGRAPIGLIGQAQGRA